MPRPKKIVDTSVIEPTKPTRTSKASKGTSAPIIDGGMDNSFEQWLYSGVRNFENTMVFGQGQENDTRSFDVGLYSRQNAQWSTVDYSPTQELALTLNLMRTRARDLYRNTSVVPNFVRLLQNFVVGHKGFGFKSLVPSTKGKINSKLAKQIEDAWNDFTSNHFDITGKFNLGSALDLWMQSLGVDGEIVAQKRYQGKYGFKVKLLHAEQLDTRSEYGDYLLGVKTDEDGIPTGYLVTSKDPRDGYVKYIELPASQLIHCFKPYMIGATRGVPLFFGSMNKIRMLEEYQKAELVAARVSASAFIKFKQQQPDDLELSQDQLKRSILKSGPMRTQVEPGMGYMLPPNVDAEFTKAEHPSTAFPSFSKDIRYEIAQGTGISYNSLYGDYEHTSYSSMRAAFINDRMFFSEIQDMIITQVLTPIFESWLDCACASGALDLPPVMGSYDFYKAHQFTGTPFAFADPIKEAQAQEIALTNRTVSKSQICEDLGYKYEDVLDRIKEEQDLENSKGITFAILPKNTAIQLAPKDTVGEALSQPPPANLSPSDPLNDPK